MFDNAYITGAKINESKLFIGYHSFVFDLYHQRKVSSAKSINLYFEDSKDVPAGNYVYVFK